MNVLIAGDFAPEARLAQQIEGKRYSEVFPEDLREVIKSADFSFVNFESPIVEDDYKPIPKCGPNLRCTQEAAEAVKYAGFTSVTLANNHVLDYGTDGLRKTVECCKAQGLDCVGVGENLKEAEEVLYLEKGGKKLAVINCCEHEFSIATETEAGANPLNPIRQFYAIQEAKKNADYVLVIVHGGHEHYQLPSLRMQETYRFFIDAGADAVVNHHQHCYSGYEVYEGKPIFYGIGNFCFDTVLQKVDSTWNYGYMVELHLENDIKFNLFPYSQYGDKTKVEMLNETTFDKDLASLNAIIVDGDRLKEANRKYYTERCLRQIFMFEPYQNRILDKLFDLKILPSTISKSRFLRIMNFLLCESHRDKLVAAMQSIKNERYE